MSRHLLYRAALPEMDPRDAEAARSRVLNALFQEDEADDLVVVPGPFPVIETPLSLSGGYPEEIAAAALAFAASGGIVQPVEVSVWWLEHPQLELEQRETGRTGHERDDIGRPRAELVLDVRVDGVAEDMVGQVQAMLAGLPGWTLPPSVASEEGDEMLADEENEAPSEAVLWRVAARGRYRLPVDTGISEALDAWFALTRGAAGARASVEVRVIDLDVPHARCDFGPLNFPVRMPRPPIKPPFLSARSMFNRFDLRRMTRANREALADDLGPEAALRLLTPRAPSLTQCGYCEETRGLVALEHAAVCSQCAETLLEGVPETPGVTLTDGNPPLVPFSVRIRCEECWQFDDSVHVVASDAVSFALCAGCLRKAVGLETLAFEASVNRLWALTRQGSRGAPRPGSFAGVVTEDGAAGA